MLLIKPQVPESDIHSSLKKKKAKIYYLFLTHNHPLFKKLHVCVYECACVCAHVIAQVGRSENSFLRLALSSTMWVPENKLSLLGWEATTEPSPSQPYDVTSNKNILSGTVLFFTSQLRTSRRLYNKLC